MLESHRLHIEEIELTDRLNSPEMMEVLSDDTDRLKERRELSKKVSELSKKRVEAIKRESEESATAMAASEAASARALPSEIREQLDLTKTANLGKLFEDIVNGRQSRGAEAEVQAAWHVGGNEFPMAMLADELRVIDAPDAGTGRPTTFGYVFGPSIADAANVTRPSVPSGQHVYPSFTSGAAATRPAKEAENVDQDPAMRGELLTPKRVQANTSIAIEDRARFAQMPQMVRQHLRAAVIAGLDAQALSDDDGFFDTSSGPLTAPGDPGSATTWAQYAAMLTGGIDGRHATGTGDVTIIVNADTHTDADALYRNNQTNESAAEVLARRGRLFTSASMPATASNVANILLARGRRPAAVQPVWANISVDDPYTDSKKGLIRFNIIALADFSVVHPDAYQWLKANTS